LIAELLYEWETTAKMTETEEDLIRDEVARICNEVALTAAVLESAERYLGPSNWDFEGAARRAAPAVGDTELSIGEMRANKCDAKRSRKCFGAANSLQAR